MRMRGLVSVLILGLPLHSGPVDEKLPIALPNPNTTPAGSLRGRTLHIDLEAKLARWHPDGDSLPGIAIEAFSEPGKRPQVPGPLIRVPRGTEILASVRNSLERDTLTFYFPAAGFPDSVAIPPGQKRGFRARAATAGTFLYRATTSTPLHRQLEVGGLLAGALVVDSLGGDLPPSDRILVILEASDSADPAFGGPSHERTVRAINGLSWPHTEWLRATVGDTVRWRVINASKDIHPMHLHGFYFRVDGLDGPQVATQGQGAPGRWVVTERMSSFATMSVTWIPERAGNWLFHCHFQKHLVPHGRFNVVANGQRLRIAPPSQARSHLHGNHSQSGMAGLVMGVEVRPRPGERIAEPGRGRRLIRLVAQADPEFPDSAPLMRYLPDGRAPARPGAAARAVSPTLYLTRGEPVSITVVNRLREPTAVHWHGIELESYFDGVPGFSGFGPRLAPLIPPGDSFEARFTPPRSGTFIYHSHVDEPRQHRAGLIGALVVRDSAPADPSQDLVFVVKSARERSDLKDPVPLEINGLADPDTTVLRVGVSYRMRFIGMQVRAPSATISLTTRPDSSLDNRPDSLLARWRPLAKDGADLPASAPGRGARRDRS